MAKIVFVPFPQVGHLNPTLKIARQLHSRGHNVSYVGSREFQGYVAAQGFAFFSIRDDLSPKGFFPDKLGNTLRSDVPRVPIDDPGALALLSEVLEKLRRISPHLIVVDILLRDIAVMARDIGLQSVLISLTLGEGQLRFSSDTYRGLSLPTLIACPREFDFPGTHRRENTCYIESLIDAERREVSFDWDRIDPAKPLIYCSLGSQSHMYEQSRDFFAVVAKAMSFRPDLQLILATGGNPNADDFGPTSANVLVVNWAPQMEILGRASIMISNAGLGTIKDCIFFGVPMVVFPVKWEQPNNAARVAYHGLGVRGDIGNASVPRILSLIDAIEQNSSIRNRLESMCKKFHLAEQQEIGAATIERILTSESRGPIRISAGAGADHTSLNR
jgi:UDP:flavonoid glycosyltransferase YjiC (YdhE family)